MGRGEGGSGDGMGGHVGSGGQPGALGFAGFAETLDRTIRVASIRVEGVAAVHVEAGVPQVSLCDTCLMRRKNHA